MVRATSNTHARKRTRTTRRLSRLTAACSFVCVLAHLLQPLRDGWVTDSLDGEPVMGRLPQRDMGSPCIHTLPNYWLHLSGDSWSLLAPRSQRPAHHPSTRRLDRAQGRGGGARLSPVEDASVLERHQRSRLASVRDQHARSKIGRISTRHAERAQGGRTRSIHRMVHQNHRGRSQAGTRAGAASGQQDRSKGRDSKTISATDSGTALLRFLLLRYSLLLLGFVHIIPAFDSSYSLLIRLKFRLDCSKLKAKQIKAAAKKKSKRGRELKRS